MTVVFGEFFVFVFDLLLWRVTSECALETDRSKVT